MPVDDGAGAPIEGEQFTGEQSGEADAGITKAEDTIERYLLAFESGTLSKARCGNVSMGSSPRCAIRSSVG